MANNLDNFRACHSENIIRRLFQTRYSNCCHGELLRQSISFNLFWRKIFILDGVASFSVFFVRFQLFSVFEKTSREKTFNSFQNSIVSPNKSFDDGVDHRNNSPRNKISIECVRYGTGILGTGMDVVPKLPKRPVPVLMPYRTYRSGIYVVPNFLNCPVPV